MQKKLLLALQNNPLLQKRVELLMTIPGVGEVTALTWALEKGEPHRMATVKDAVSYCGLCSAQKESAGKNNRGPISKKRNKHLQHVIIETAKLAPRWMNSSLPCMPKSWPNGQKNYLILASLLWKQRCLPGGSLISSN